MSYRESTKSNPCSMAAVAGMAALVTCLAACNDAARIDVPTSPLSLEGTSPVEWSSHERISHFISAADGVRLAVDVVLPAGYTGEGEGATSFPVVFRYTPYHRTSIVPETGEVPLAPFDSFIARGYACVAADFTHDASFGPPLDASQISVANAMKGKAPFNAPSFGHSRQQMFGVPGDLPYRAEKDEQVLTYTSTPLEADTEVTGHPTVSVLVSSTADHGDLYFYLEDVDPEGNAVLVTEYQHRAGFDRLVDKDLMIPGTTGIDVKPELPWHGFREADYTDRVFADGAVVRVTTSLYPTSRLFRTGHRIRLSTGAVRRDRMWSCRSFRGSRGSRAMAVWSVPVGTGPASGPWLSFQT